MKNNMRKVAVETEAKVAVETEAKVKTRTRGKVTVDVATLDYWKQKVILDEKINIDSLNDKFEMIFDGTFKLKYFKELTKKEQYEVVEYPAYDNLQRLFLYTRICNINDIDIAEELNASVKTIRQYLSRGISRAIRIHSRDLPKPEHRIKVGQPVKNSLFKKTILRLGYGLSSNRKTVDTEQMAISAVKNLECSEEYRQRIIELIKTANRDNCRE